MAMRKAEEQPSQACPELQVAEQTATGSGRSHNEDHVRHCVPEDVRLRSRKGVLCLVADGMGGRKAGEVASREAVELVGRHYYEDPSRDPAGSLARAFSAANATIGQLADLDRGRTGMGTTLVVAAIRGSQVVVASVGDSRAYHVGKRCISQITTDHTWVDEQVKAGLLTPEQARTHPQRNLVTRALGTRPEVEVDLYEGSIESGDCLVLCTDGLSNQVEDGEIEVAVRTRPAEEAALALVDLVGERGGRDDATVLVVRAAGERGSQGLAARNQMGAKWTWLLLGSAVVLGLLALLLYLVPGV